MRRLYSVGIPPEIEAGRGGELLAAQFRSDMRDGKDLGRAGENVHIKLVYYTIECGGAADARLRAAGVLGCQPSEIEVAPLGESE